MAGLVSLVEVVSLVEMAGPEAIVSFLERVLAQLLMWELIPVLD